MAEALNESTRIVSPEVKRMNPLDRLLSIFVSPVSLMKNIRVYQAVLVPLIVVTLFSLAMLPFSTRYSEIQTRWLSRVSLERYGVDYFNLTPVDDEDTTAQTVSVITQTTTVFTALVSYPVSAFFAALGLFILTKIARGSAKLLHYFSMYMHLFVITAIGALITCAISVALDTPLDTTSLAAAFMPLGDVTMPAYNILTSITVFNIWTAALTIVGIKHINECSTIKAVVLGGVAYVFSVAMASIFLSMTFLAFDLLNGLSISGL